MNFCVCSAIGKMSTVFTCKFLLSIRGTNLIAHWAYAERISLMAEHTRNRCWACAEMFKSRISRLNRIQFSIISCYRPLGPYGFSFCKKSIKKFHACVPLKQFVEVPRISVILLLLKISFGKSRFEPWVHCLRSEVHDRLQGVTKRCHLSFFKIIVFVQGGSLTPHPFSSQPHFACKFSRQRSTEVF